MLMYYSSGAIPEAERQCLTEGTVSSCGILVKFYILLSSVIYLIKEIKAGLNGSSRFS